MFFGSRVRLKSVAAGETAALCAWQALEHNDRVGGMVIGNADHTIHKPYRSIKTVARFLGALAERNQTLTRGQAVPAVDHFANVLTQIRRLAHSNYRIYFISDFARAAEAWREAFRNLSRHNEVVALRVYDTLERDLPPANAYTVTDGSARWQFHTGDPRLRSQYRSRYETEEHRFRRMCEQTMVAHRSLATHEPLTTVSGLL